MRSVWNTAKPYHSTCMRKDQGRGCDYDCVGHRFSVTLVTRDDKYVQGRIETESGMMLQARKWPIFSALVHVQSTFYVNAAQTDQGALIA